MKKFRCTACALLVGCLVAIGVLSRFVPMTSAQAPTVKVKWEYKVYNADLDWEKKISKLGDDGWELVSATFSPNTGSATLYFKRAK